jgi:hypothetical protein
MRWTRLQLGFLILACGLQATRVKENGQGEIRAQ